MTHKTTSVVTPYKDSANSKKEQVAQMFNSISSRYDFLNHFLSLGVDKRWRKRAVKEMKRFNPGLVLDVATGTGDLAVATLALFPEKVIGIDISSGMLEKGKEKILKKGLENKIEFRLGDSEQLEFNDNNFEVACVAFGVRNFENLQQGLQELKRVIKPGGGLVVLEFSKPKKFPIKQLYAFQSRFLIPLIGRLVSGEKSAYKYLPESIQAFPEGKEFLKQLELAGFSEFSHRYLTGGIASLYVAVK